MEALIKEAREDYEIIRHFENGGRSTNIYDLHRSMEKINDLASELHPWTSEYSYEREIELGLRDENGV